MKFPKIYLEITNVCNLSCSFCAGTTRKPTFLSPSDFRRFAAEARPFTDYLYLHVMGEPLLHPQLDELLSIATDLGFRICLTTNGSLLEKHLPLLLAYASSIYKISVSLHAFEANTEARMGMDFASYIQSCCRCAEALGKAGVIVALRLWNLDNPEAAVPAKNQENQDVLSLLRRHFPHPWTPNRRGSKIGKGVYLEWGEKFDWPVTDGSVPDRGTRAHCFAMKDHIAILSDGSVLPCCIDRNGVMSLGDLRERSLSEILTDESAIRFQTALSEHALNFFLCRHCNFK